MNLSLGLNFGYVMGSSALAAILYQTSLGDFVYTTDGSGNVILDNQGWMRAPNDGLTYSGRGLELLATNSVKFPIHHTLSAELITNGTFDTDTSWTKGTGWTISGGTANCDGTSLNIIQSELLVTGTVVLVTFSVTAYTSGSVTPLVGTEGGGIGKVAVSAIGTYTQEITVTTMGFLGFRSTSFIGSIDNVSFKQITNPNSYMTYYNFSTSGFVTVDCSTITPSTTYTLNTKTINNVLTHTTAWSTTAWTKINNNPNLVGKLALETLGATKTIPELDMVMDAGASADKWYPCSEKEKAYIVEARAGYGPDLRSDWLTHAYSVGLVTYSTSGGVLEVSATNTAVGDYQIYDSAGAELVTVVGKIYAISGTLVSNNFVTYTAIGLSVYDMTNAILTLATENARYGKVNEEVTHLFKATGTVSRIYPIKIRSATGHSLGTTASVRDISVREATAQEISNYAETVRTNADLSQKGLQTTAFVQDGAGVPTAYSSNLLQFNGDGRYVDTKWIPSHNQPWTIKYTYYHSELGVAQRSGVFESTSAMGIIIERTNSTTLGIRIGNVYNGITVSSGTLKVFG